MYTFVTILIMIISALLILVVLIQKPKGGGLASNFSASNQVMGVKRTKDVVENTTWILAMALFVLALGINYFIPREIETELKDSRVKESIQAMPSETPAAVPPAADAPASADEATPNEATEGAN